MGKFLVRWNSVETIEHTLEVEAPTASDAADQVRKLIASHGESSVDYEPIEDNEVSVMEIMETSTKP